MRIFFVAALTLLLSGCGDGPEKQVQDGNQLFADFDYVGAEAKYRAAKDALPAVPEIDFNLGATLFKQFKYDDALQHYATADATAAGSLAVHTKYNLANLYYQLALDAMSSNQDVKTPLRQAIVLYRDSLALDPGHDNALYNLALAKSFLWEIDNQNVVPQPNARVRDQKQSENKGQMRTEGGDKAKDKDDTKNPEAQEGDSQQASRQGQKQEQSNQGKESQRASEPRTMSVEAAERMISMIRERNRAVEAQRQQWRRNQMRNTDVKKYW